MVAGIMLLTVPQPCLVEVKVQLVRLARLAGVRPPAAGAAALQRSVVSQA